jgi:hypothetical protein
VSSHLKKRPSALLCVWRDGIIIGYLCSAEKLWHVRLRPTDSGNFPLIHRMSTQDRLKLQGQAVLMLEAHRQNREGPPDAGPPPRRSHLRSRSALAAASTMPDRR